MRIKGLIAGGVAAALGIGLLATAPANAATTSEMITVRWPSSSYTSPSQGSTVINHYDTGNRLEAHCYVTGDYTNGSNVWIRLPKHHGGGWIPRSAIDTAPLPPC
ncbi:hypothetical protein [Agromyces sp. Marseille-P2726]|uniref:hypothetical protein n=1 Tax=Agromyces sp. Marseille-P2726 TaxID=2709132 RepID=UPI00156FECEF|nr:hypothetical protein [Agromyces sp. Marseille-P2726]